MYPDLLEAASPPSSLLELMVSQPPSDSSDLSDNSSIPLCEGTDKTMVSPNKSSMSKGKTRDMSDKTASTRFNTPMSDIDDAISDISHIAIGEDSSDSFSPSPGPSTSRKTLKTPNKTPVKNTTSPGGIRRLKRPAERTPEESREMRKRHKEAAKERVVQRRAEALKDWGNNSCKYCTEYELECIPPPLEDAKQRRCKACSEGNKECSIGKVVFHRDYIPSSITPLTIDHALGLDKNTRESDKKIEVLQQKIRKLEKEADCLRQKVKTAERKDELMDLLIRYLNRMWKIEENIKSRSNRKKVPVFTDEMLENFRAYTKTMHDDLDDYTASNEESD